jgi:hypothetical protein
MTIAQISELFFFFFFFFFFWFLKPCLYLNFIKKMNEKKKKNKLSYLQKEFYQEYQLQLVLQKNILRVKIDKILFKNFFMMNYLILTVIRKMNFSLISNKFPPLSFSRECLGSTWDLTFAG